MAIPRADIQADFTAIGIPLMAWRQADLATMALSGTAGDHFLTLSTEDILLTGNTPSSSTVTDISRFQFTLPPSYQAGSDITFRVTAVVNAVADTNTVDLSAYRVTATSGAVGSGLDLLAALQFGDLRDAPGVAARRAAPPRLYRPPPIYSVKAASLG